MQSDENRPARSAKDQFDRQAVHYDTQWNGWNSETLDWMLRAGCTRQTDHILDVATGGGFTAIAFAPRAATVVGLDISTGMLEEARKRAAELHLENVQFQEGAAENLEFTDESFECVTCRVAAHHFVSVDRFIEECRRVLVPGGKLLVADTTVPNGDDEAAAWQNSVEALRDGSHVRNYAPSEWRALVEAVGLNVTELIATGGGITIPLTDWMRKSGCDGLQAEAVRRSFEEAPLSARKQFDLRFAPDGEIVFTWQRICIAAQKKAS